MSAKKKVDLAVAKATALMNWNPAKHPRGRDGKFIEVGDTVQVFSGPNGSQIATGVVKGGYFAPPPDGRMFIAVQTDTGVQWFRPKQLQSAKVKAKLPSGPLPVVDSKDEDFDWVGFDGADMSIEQVSEFTKASVTDAKGVPAPTDPAAMPKGGSHTLPAGAVGYASSDYTTSEPLVGRKFQKTGESFVAQGYTYTLGTVKAPFGSGESDVSGTLVTNVANGAYVFFDTSPGKVMELDAGDLGILPSVPEVPDTGPAPTPAQVADNVADTLKYKGFEITPYQKIDGQSTWYAQVVADDGTLVANAPISVGDPDQYWYAKNQVDSMTATDTALSAPLTSPGAPKPVPSTPQSLTSPDAIKLPKGKTPADVLMAIKTSAANKGLDEGEALSMLQSALNDPNPVTAHKKLAEVMTYAKLGGKQRARYKKLLDMHMGVTSSESEGAMVLPQGTTIHHTGELPGITGMKAVSGPGVKVVNLTQGKAWLQKHVEPQPWQLGTPYQADKAKAAIQADLLARTADTISIDQIVAMPASWYGEGGRMKDLRKLHESKRWAASDPGHLRRTYDGGWEWQPGVANSSELSSGRSMPMTEGNLELALRDQLIRDLVQTWAATSNDNNPRSLAVQLAIEEEFKLKDVAPWNTSASQADKEYAQNGAVYRAFVRAMYEATQARLKKDGITHVTVRRGMALPNSYQYAKGSTYEISLRPASSFSSNASTATGFKHGGIVIQGIVPIERILGNALTGFGCLNEYEWVVLGGIDQWKVMAN